MGSLREYFSCEDRIREIRFKREAREKKFVFKLLAWLNKDTYIPGL